jgi:broad specificity phosphatase PhoE
MPLVVPPFYFVRHGETDWNRKHIAMGQTDIGLNETGLAQARAVAKHLKGEPFKSIAASPLKRARQTAEIIVTHTPTPITFFNELKEGCWGIKQGAPHDGWLERWREGEIIEGAESFDEFIERVRKGLNDIFQLPQPVLIISHGGVYIALHKILGFPFVDLENCAAIFHRPPEHSHHPWFICSFDGKEKTC